MKARSLTTKTCKFSASTELGFWTFSLLGTKNLPNRNTYLLPLITSLEGVYANM